MNRKTIDLRPRQQRRLSRPFNKHNCCSIPHRLTLPTPLNRRTIVGAGFTSDRLFSSLCPAPCSICHSALLPALYITLPCSLAAILPGQGAPLVVYPASLQAADQGEEVLVRHRGGGGGHQGAGRLQRELVSERYRDMGADVRIPDSGRKVLNY